jgi:hypothetical protein
MNQALVRESATCVDAGPQEGAPLPWRRRSPHWRAERRTGLWGTGLWGTGTRLRTAGSYRTGARIRNAGLRGTGAGLRSARLCGTGAGLRSACILWSRSARRTASLCRAGARLPVGLCGGIRAEAARRHPLQRRGSLHRQSRPRAVGILPLKQRCASAKDGFKNGPSASSVLFRRFGKASGPQAVDGA